MFISVTQISLLSFTLGFLILGLKFIQHIVTIMFMKSPGYGSLGLVWMRLVPTDSNVWIFDLQLVELFGKVWLCGRRYVTGGGRGGLWGFKVAMPFPVPSLPAAWGCRCELSCPYCCDLGPPHLATPESTLKTEWMSPLGKSHWVHKGCIF